MNYGAVQSWSGDRLGRTRLGERYVISGEHNCPRSGGKALGEKYGEDVAETLESSRVI